MGEVLHESSRRNDERGGALRPRDEFGPAVELMPENAGGFVHVARGRGNVFGVITDRDISIASGTPDRRASEVHPGDAMPLKLFTCTDDQDLRRVNQELETFAYSAIHDLQ